MTDTIETPKQASVWEAELYRLLTTHVVAERELLEGYVEAARSTGSKALAYLVDLLIEDEKRHHRLFSELAESIHSESSLKLEEPTVPRLDFDRQNAASVLEVSKRLLASEKNDLKELKALKKTLRDVEDTTLWSLLVDLMVRDTEKHIAILRYAERQAKRTGR